MAMTADLPRAYELGGINHLPAEKDHIFYQGAAIGDNGSGYAQPLATGNDFLGFCLRHLDTNGDNDGDHRVELRWEGLVELDVTGALITSIGSPVYASDDGTFTMTAGSNSHIGVVHRFVSSGRAVVRFNATKPPATIESANISDGAITTAKLGADAVDGTKMADNAISLEHLDAAITPSHIVVAGGVHDWAGGAATADSIDLSGTGLVAGDVVVASLAAAAGTEQLQTAVVDAGTDQVDLVLTENGTDTTTKVAYAVYRAAA